MTVTIPIYDPNGLEKSRVLRAIESTTKQDMPPSTISIASNHEIPYLQEIEKLTSGKMTLEFIKNESRSASENLNSLLGTLRTEYCKILFQDDFFKSSNSIQDIYLALSGKKSKWLIHGCDHFYEEEELTSRVLKPKIRSSLRRGVNKIGAPSVVAFKSGDIPLFNENMVYMFDCEWYLAMLHKFGNPMILNHPLVTIGIHQTQATTWAKGFLESEVGITKILHHRKNLSRQCVCSGKRKSND